MKTNNKIWKRTFQIILAATVLLLTVNQRLEAQANTAYGTEALKSNTTGNWNTAFGYQSLYSNTTGGQNTAIGTWALVYSTTGHNNTANGSSALYFNTTGSGNTAMGSSALSNNTIGGFNTANGYGVLGSSTTGSYNTGNGAWALGHNTTGGDNTANGMNALSSNTTGSGNTANGTYSLLSNTTGKGNTANGSSALLQSTTGDNNVADGNRALFSNTSGNYNAALGSFADVTSGNLTNATAIGANAKVSSSNTMQFGDNNVSKIYAGVGNAATLVAGGLQITGGSPAAGRVLTSIDAVGSATWQDPASVSWSLKGNLGTVDGTNFIGTTDAVPFNIRVNNKKAGRIDFDGNAFYGYQAGSNTIGSDNTASGFRALQMNTTGVSNTASGSQALYSNTTGGYNTALGYYADVGSGNLTNATAIGAKARVMTSNTIQLGDNTVTKVYAGTATNATLIAGTLQTTSGAINTANSPVLTIEVNNQKAGKIDANTNNTLYGYQAGNSNKGGWGNTANGYQALYSNTDGFANIANGAYALYKNTIGGSNIATGYQALYANTEGGANIADGNQALASNTKGDHNVAVGHYALYSNQTGHRNVAVGHYALYTNKDGVYNTAIGVDALLNNVSGGDNTASGYRALANNSKGGGNTATGSHTLFSNTGGGDNTASGSHALNSNINGGGNTANGYLALYANVDGNFNTALGTYADVTSGNLTNATAIGYNAKVSASNTIQLGNNAVTKVYAGVDTNARLIAGGLQITGGTPATGKVLTSDASGLATWQTPAVTGWGLTGNASTVDGTHFIGTTDPVPFNIRVNNQKAGRIENEISIDKRKANTFYGYQAGNANAAGYNTANGYQALYANTTGDGNTAVGDRSLLANTSGNYNTAVGSLALKTSTKGKYNTAIGYNADIANKDSIGNDITNATAIGAGAIVSISDKIRLGDAAVTVIEGQVDFSFPSDGRFKTNISENDVKGLEFIKRLRPVVYNFDTKKFQAFLTQNMPEDARKEYMNKDFSASTAIRQSGFIAQEVEKAAQEIGYDFNGLHKPENDNDNYSLAYGQFVVPLVKAVQELDKKDEQKDKQIEQLQKEKEQQQKINEQLQQRIEALEKRMAGNSNLSNEPVNKITTSSEAEGLKLFPNPTTGIFTIMANHITNATIEVYDMMGNSVKKEMFANIKSGYQLDLSGHAKGTYWVNIISGNKKYTKQIVVQ